MGAEKRLSSGKTRQHRHGRTKKPPGQARAIIHIENECHGRNRYSPCPQRARSGFCIFCPEILRGATEGSGAEPHPPRPGLAGSQALPDGQPCGVDHYPGANPEPIPRVIKNRARVVETRPGIIAAWTLTGQADYLLPVHCETLSAFHRLIQEALLPHPAGLRVESRIVVTSFQGGRPLPI